MESLFLFDVILRSSPDNKKTWKGEMDTHFLSNNGAAAIKPLAAVTRSYTGLHYTYPHTDYDQNLPFWQ